MVEKSVTYQTVTTVNISVGYRLHHPNLIHVLCDFQFCDEICDRTARVTAHKISICSLGGGFIKGIWL